MGNKYSIKKHYPYDLAHNQHYRTTHASTCLFTRISTLESKYRYNITNKLNIVSYKILIIFVPKEFEINNYDELCSRLIINDNIVVVININKNINNVNIFDNTNQYISFIYDLLKNIRNDFMLHYNCTFIANDIILIGHLATCNDIISLYYNNIINDIQIIFIDPVLNIENIQKIKQNSNLNNNDNIAIILPSDFEKNNTLNQHYNLLHKLSYKIFMLINVNSTNIHNTLVPNFVEINDKCKYWDQISSTILKILM